MQVDCANFISWPRAAAACKELQQGTAPAAQREEWVLILSLPTLRPAQRFFFTSVEISGVAADGETDVHGLLGQRAALGEAPSGTSYSRSRGAFAEVEFGPQGEGAIEGTYHDYRRPALHAHNHSSPYNRFSSCTATTGRAQSAQRAAVPVFQGGEGIE